MAQRLSAAAEMNGWAVEIVNQWDEHGRGACQHLHTPRIRPEKIIPVGLVGECIAT